MIFSCTGKVQKKIKGIHHISPNKENIGIGNWYIGLINLERKSHLLFTNSLTLFSFVVYAGTKKEIKNIEVIFKTKLEEQLIREYGIIPPLIDKAIPEKSDVIFTKTNSRSILGSMNDFKVNIKSYSLENGISKSSIQIINHTLNQMPMGAINYNQPKIFMKETLLQM